MNKIKGALNKAKTFIGSSRGTSSILATMGAACFCIAGFTVVMWLGLSITGLALISAAYNLDPSGGNDG